MRPWGKKAQTSNISVKKNQIQKLPRFLQIRFQKINLLTTSPPEKVDCSTRLTELLEMALKFFIVEITN